MTFQETCCSCHSLLTDQHSLPDCLFFLRYWSICVLHLLTRFWRYKRWHKLNLHDQNVKTKMSIFWERKECLMWNNKYSFTFLRTFICKKLSQLREYTSNLKIFMILIEINYSDLNISMLFLFFFSNLNVFILNKNVCSIWKIYANRKFTRSLK